MLFRGSLIAQASGSVAGNTFSRNRGGQYIRNRATPVNPNTPQQIAVRAIFSDLTNLWSSTLTNSQRNGWNAYAVNVPVLNRLGDSIFLTGFNHYVRSNTPRVQAGLARVDDSPPENNLGSFTPVAMTAEVTTDNIAIVFTNTDDWANEDDSSLLVYGSRSVQQTINFFKGPFRFAGLVAGNSTIAPTSPAVLTNDFTNIVGQLIYVRVRVSRADGRLSNDQICSATVAA